jgi:predicted RND superfamily exporter protein
MSLNQIGVGPETGFFILDKTAKWSDYLGTNTTLESVKTYIYLKTRLIFDPPTSPSVLEAMERLIKEIEWRVMVQAEPEPIPVPIEGGIEDA